MAGIISNKEALATTESRKDALEIIEAGYKAIDTVAVIHTKIFLKDGALFLDGVRYELAQYERIFIIGFGKASCVASQELEAILGDTLDGGIVIDKKGGVCKVVHVYQGSHPLPSPYNVEVSQKIAELAQGLTEKDLALVIVSGGGSSLLSFPMSECEQGNTLYSSFLHAGGTIGELNILRKHISSIKGGGLAQMLYPATVAGLIFCDVPGDHFQDVASGPTYFDSSTVEDARTIVEKYGLSTAFTFNETPKDHSLFSKVKNIPLVSNKEALRAMEEEGKKRGYRVVCLGDEVYDTPEDFLKKAHSSLSERTVVIAGGELSMAVTHTGGTDGRNLYVAGEALSAITDDDVFVSFATDGIDNKSIAAGAIVDSETKKKIQERNIDATDFHTTNRDGEIFISADDAIITGETGSNVSDLYLMLRK